MYADVTQTEYDNNSEFFNELIYASVINALESSAELVVDTDATHIYKTDDLYIQVDYRSDAILKGVYIYAFSAANRNPRKMGGLWNYNALALIGVRDARDILSTIEAHERASKS